MPSDVELIRSVPNDPEALGVFYDRHERALLGFLVRATSDPETAADIAAESFAAMLQARLRGIEIREPKAWLFAVARRRVVDAARRGAVDDSVRRALGLEALVLGEGTRDEIERLGSEVDHDVLDALATLPEDQRSAVHARVVEETSYDDLSVQLNVSPSVLRQRVSRGLRALRRQLTESSS